MPPPVPTAGTGGDGSDAADPRRFYVALHAAKLKVLLHVFFKLRYPDTGALSTHPQGSAVGPAPRPMHGFAVIGAENQLLPEAAILREGLEFDRRQSRF